MNADQPSYKMAKSIHYDENAIIQPHASFKTKRFVFSRLCHEILILEKQWLQQQMQRNLKKPPNLARPQVHAPLKAMTGGVARLGQPIVTTKQLQSYSQPIPEPLHMRRTPSPQTPPGSSSLVAKSVGLAEIRREKLIHRLKNVESKGDMQSKLNDLDGALRGNHLSVQSAPMPFSYINYLKMLRKQQPEKKRELTIEEKNKMKEFETVILPKKIVHKTFQPSVGTCCCDRPIGRVVCYFCLYTQAGRKMTMCPKHPKKIYLSDFSACPNCMSTTYLLEEVNK